MRSSRISPGMTAPAVVSQSVPPPTMQLDELGFWKPVPASSLMPCEQLSALTELSQHNEFTACVSQILNRSVPAATLMPMGHFWLFAVYVSRFLSTGLANGVGVPDGVSTSAMN